MNERLTKRLRRRSPNGKRRATTTKPRRNTLVVDFGEDVFETKMRIEEVAAEQGRSVSSLVREVLRKHFLTR